MDFGSHEDTPLGKAAADAVFIKMGLKGTFPAPTHTRILTVANQKGGVGKTTTAVNLSAAMALAGLKVLLIDLDMQGNASTALGVAHEEGTPGTYEVLIENALISDLAVPAQGFDTLWCLPATIDLAGAERELGSDNDADWPFLLRKAIATYVETNPVDYIFIDCPPSLGRLTVNALSAVSEVLVPIQCEFYALEGVQQLMQTVKLVQQNLNPELSISTILLTMFQRGTNLAVQVADEVRAFFGDKVLETMIPRNIYVAEAPSFGQSVLTYDPGSKGSVAYVDAAREIAHRGVVQGEN